jgi:glycosyltransferase involved in cell wall biosynthesis
MEASLLVVPSLDEGFGMTALEAMHMGVPVVASNRGALPEVVGNAGVTVDATDAGALAAAMRAVLEDPARAGALVAAGRVRARHFSWDGSAARLLGAYREAVARRRRSAAG